MITLRHATWMVDRHVNQITLRQMIKHLAGWEYSLSYLGHHL